jgi:hypothetical protein
MRSVFEGDIDTREGQQLSGGSQGAALRIVALPYCLRARQMMETIYWTLEEHYRELERTSPLISRRLRSRIFSVRHLP